MSTLRQMKYFQEIAQLLTKHSFAAEGCSAAGIASLACTLPYKLPNAYQEFLLLFGRNPAGFLVGSEIEFKYLQSMRREADEILLRNDASALAADEFVFFLHQNYSFYTFKLGTEDDPDILLSIEGGEEFEQRTNYGPFSTFIKQQFDSHFASGYLNRWRSSG